jgi:D-psicose/D-tagatose/L-ribulose 3-epimerase
MTRLGMHSSLWTATWTPAAAEIAVGEAAKYGIEVIEVSLLTPETIDVEHSRAVFKEYGVSPSGSLCLPMEANAARHPKAAEAFLLKALDVAHAIGCEFLGGVTYSTLGWRSGSAPTDEEYANIAKALKPVARRAAEYGVTIGLEPCNRYETHLINTAEQALHLMDRIGESNLTIHLDTYHMNIEEQGLEAGFQTAGKATKYVHISESHRGVPGTGSVAWDQAFAALAGGGFDGDLVIESFVTLPPEIASALSVWRPVAKDRFEVLDRGVPFVMNLARKHGLRR